jgi:thiol-disulfide isomerase/thioredoxin
VFLIDDGCTPGCPCAAERGLRRLTVSAVDWRCMKTIRMVALGVMAVGLGGVAGAQHGAGSEQDLKVPVLTREALPEPKLTFRDLEGKEHRLAEFKGKVVVLNFWGTWCAGCVLEMPTLQRLYDRYRSDPKVAFVIVSGMDTPEKVRKFVAAKQYTLPVYVVGNDPLPKPLDGGAWPATYLISPSGVVRAELQGSGNWTDPSVAAVIEGLKKQ